MKKMDRIKRWLCGGERYDARWAAARLSEENAKQLSMMLDSIMPHLNTYAAEPEEAEPVKLVAEIEWIADDQTYQCWVTVNGKAICSFRFTNFVRRGRNIYFYNGNETVDDNYRGIAWGDDIDIRVVSTKEEQ